MDFRFRLDKNAGFYFNWHVPDNGRHLYVTDHYLLQFILISDLQKRPVFEFSEVMKVTVIDIHIYFLFSFGFVIF